jgi:GTP-binding protein
VSAPLGLEFVTSAPDAAHLPPSRAELAVVGRSNVGKSSLLNAVAGRKGLAHVSKTPGRTQLLNCYRAGRPDSGATVVDCPGYGYAAVSKAMRASWQGMIEGYLLDREPLTMVVVLVDGEVGPTRLDVDMLGWVRANALPHTVVATKHDKVRASQRERRKRDLAAGCHLERGDVVWVSAVSGVGIDRLRDLARLWLDVPPAGG